MALFTLSGTLFAAALLLNGEAAAGGWLPMHAWHPLVVHFPIAFLLAAPVMELLGWATGRPGLRRAGLGVLLAGIVFSIPAIASGLIAYNRVDHSDASHDVMLLHRNLSILAVGVFAVMAGWRVWWRDRVFQRAATGAAYAGLALIGFGSMAVAGDLGARLVFDHGVGISDDRLTNIADARGDHAHNGDHDHGHDDEHEDEHAHEDEHDHDEPAHEHAAADPSPLLEADEVTLGTLMAFLDALVEDPEVAARIQEESDLHDLWHAEDVQRILAGHGHDDAPDDHEH